jgi:REP element-mobilizing transposase RayT
MRDRPYLLSEAARWLVLSSILEVCAIRGWNLLAAHVRTNHAYAVFEADAIPEKVLLDFKVNSSRELNRQEGKRMRWARHGSTRYLWTKSEIDRAVGYVVSKQGPPMSLYEAPPRAPAQVAENISS